jgi:membrane protease YdiL (CAAX protease family)
VKHCANDACPDRRDGVMAEYRDAVEICPRCESALVAGPADPPPEPAEREWRDLVPVDSCPDVATAQIRAASLEAAGIPAVVQNELGGLGFVFTGAGSVRVLVPPDRMLEARELLETDASDDLVDLPESGLPPDREAPAAVERSVSLIPSREPRRSLYLELGVVLCLGFLTPTVFAIYVFVTGHRSGTPFTWKMVNQLAQDLALTVPLLYILARSADAWSSFGIRPLRLVLDPLVALFTLACAGLAIALVRPLLAFLPYASQPPLDPLDGAAIYALLVVAMVGNAIAEELMVRAYLITRLRQLGLSVLPAIALSSALWATYHLSHGVRPVAVAFVHGLVLGAVFVYVRRLWPLVIAHAVYDIWVSLP